MLSLSMFNDSNIKVVAFVDGAVTCTREAYDNYLTTLDESLLNLSPEVEPTRFVLKKYLTQKESIAIKDDMVAFDSERNVKVKISTAAEEVRRAVVGIESPEGGQSITWKKDAGDQWLDRDLFAKLDQVGIVQDLDTARKNFMSSTQSNPTLLKKN